MGNFIAAIEDIAAGHDMGNNRVGSTIAGAGLGAGLGGLLAAGILSVPFGPVTIGAIAGAVIVGALAGGIAWFMGEKKYVDFRQALNDKNLGYLFDNMVEIQKMAENDNDVNAAKKALQGIAAQHSEFKELFEVFRLALDANFHCAKCGSHLEVCLQICLCHIKKFPHEMHRWTCHCLNKSHSCCE